MQNFYAKTTKPTRVTPAQTHGREIAGEVRVKVNGESTQVIDYYCTTREDRLQVFVKVFDPITGGLLFNKILYVER